MSETRVPPKISAPVWAAFRRHCHRFLAIGYQQALVRIRNGPDEETDITGFICEAIKQWFRENPIESFCFAIRDDPPLGGSGRTGKHRLRSDIIIEYAAGNRPEFYFEANRLHRTKARAFRYTSEVGMGCFISGRYASDYHEAAMVGYVQTDSLEHWCSTLRSKVETDRFELKVERTEQYVTFSDSFQWEWASSHRREGLSPVRLFHILLDCRKGRPE